MSATQLDEGTITIARAVSEHLRTLYPGIRLSDAEAQQALVSGYAQIGGRHTPIGDLVSQVIAARSARLLTTMRQVLQDEQSFSMTKRGNGEGSVFQRKADKKWVASITLDDGKRKVLYGKTKKEVTEKLIQQKGQPWDEQRWLFCKPDGKHLNPQHDVYEEFKEILNKAGLPDIRFHDLRHTAATMHLGMMTNLKIVQEILGHSTISITMDAYSHVLPPMHKEAMGNINEWLIAHTEAQEKDQAQHEETKDDANH